MFGQRALARLVEYLKSVPNPEGPLEPTWQQEMLADLYAPTLPVANPADLLW